MRPNFKFAHAVAVLVLVLSALLAGQEMPSSPNDRKATDPKSIDSPSSKLARPVPIDDLFYSRRVASPAWSPDGKQIVFSTNFTGRMNLWKVQSDGGWPLQLTVSDDRQSGAIWSPDGKWIVYHQDFGGSEYYDLFAVSSRGGAPVNLTNTPDISETGPLFSPDGKTIAFEYKPKTSSDAGHCAARLELPPGKEAHQRADERSSLAARRLDPRRQIRDCQPHQCRFR